MRVRKRRSHTSDSPPVKKRRRTRRRFGWHRPCVELVDLKRPCHSTSGPSSVATPGSAARWRSCSFDGTQRRSISCRSVWNITRGSRHLRWPWRGSLPRDDQLRDGVRVLALVQALAEPLRTTAVAETLAMAHAELGPFVEAVEWQRLAMFVATDAGQSAAVQGMSANLALFLSGQPSRTPWRVDELE